MSKSTKTFVANEDNLSPAHAKYRLARAKLAIEHQELHRRAAAAWDGSVSQAEAEADCRLFLENIETGIYEPERYLATYVARVVSGEANPDTTRRVRALDESNEQTAAYA